VDEALMVDGKGHIVWREVRPALKNGELTLMFAPAQLGPGSFGVRLVVGRGAQAPVTYEYDLRIVSSRPPIE
jgi:hypothetical protein